MFRYTDVFLLQPLMPQFLISEHKYEKRHKCRIALHCGQIAGATFQSDFCIVISIKIKRAAIFILNFRYLCFKIDRFIDEISVAQSKL